MAFSGTTTFSMTRDEIIRAALRKCRAIDAESDAPEPHQTKHAAESLNRIVKRLATQGTLLWAETEVVVDLAKGKRSYTIGPSGDVVGDRPLRIHNTRWRDITDNTDIPITLKGRTDYLTLTNKFSTGRPTWVYYDRRINDGEVTVWPVPEDSKGQLRFTADVSIQDFNASGDEVHAPSYAYDYLVYALAADQAPEYGLPPQDTMYLEQKAAGFKDDLLDFEEEESGFQLVPDMTHVRFE